MDFATLTFSVFGVVFFHELPSAETGGSIQNLAINSLMAMFLACNIALNFSNHLVRIFHIEACWLCNFTIAVITEEAQQVLKIVRCAVSLKHLDFKLFTLPDMCLTIRIIKHTRQMSILFSTPTFTRNPLRAPLGRWRQTATHVPKQTARI